MNRQLINPSVKRNLSLCFNWDEAYQLEEKENSMLARNSCNQRSSDQTENPKHSFKDNEDRIGDKNLDPSNTKDKPKYFLRNLPKKSYCGEDQKENEDYSPDVSEYIPSPERLKLRRFSDSSSLGGNSQYLEEVNQKISRTPSTISNVSLILNHIDFVASPTVVYATNSEPSTSDIRSKRIPSPNFSINPLDITLKPARNIVCETEYERTFCSDNCEIGVNKETTLCTNTFEANTTRISSIEMRPLVLESKSNTEISTIPVNDTKLPKDIDSSPELEKTLKPESILRTYDLIIEITTENDDECLKSPIPTPESVSTLSMNSMASKMKYENMEYKSQSNVIQTKQQMECSPIKSFCCTETDQGDELVEVLILHDDQEQTEANIISSTPNNDSVAICESVDQVFEISENNNECENNIKKCRKRLRNHSEWNDNKSKRLKNSGESYVGCRSKKVYSKKVIGPVCQCKKKCAEKITNEQRENIFHKFYKLADHELHWQYIVRQVTTNDVKRITLDRKKHRIQTIHYSFNVDGTKIPVCKVYFLNTLNISEQIVYTALEKVKRDESLTDHRGTHFNRPHRMSPITEESITIHIRLFPTEESHYVRKQTQREYLSKDLNISKMYRLYKMWFPNQNYSADVLATKRQYETIFNTKFNYSFFKPKKDLCSTCVLYRQADETRKIDLEEDYKKHIERKDKVRNIKASEKNTLDRTSTTIAIFDLEKVIHIPQTEVGEVHYKRKYPIYNFTVWDSLLMRGYCYVWHHNIAKRGAIEIGSCLLKFMTQEHERGIKHIAAPSEHYGNVI